MTTVAAEQLQPQGQELLVPDYRTAELGTPAHFVGLQARWEQMRVHSYPEIENATDAEAFSNSRRHTGDFLCAPETVDALLLLAQNDPALEPGHPAADAIKALGDMLGTIDDYKTTSLLEPTDEALAPASELDTTDSPTVTENNLTLVDDATALAGMRAEFYSGNMTYADYTKAYNAVRKHGTAYLAARLTDIPEDETITRYEGSELVTQNLREVATRAILKNTELEQGLGFNEQFIADLERTEALVLSLDINGATFTLPDQVTPNAQMISIVNESINLLRAQYASTFPGRRAYIIPNTGMGGNYARGVIETAGPLVADAVFGESGGVEVVRNGDATTIELTLDHPDLYLMALKRIEEHVHGAVDNRKDMVTAPKDSMSSLMIADPHSQETLLRTEDGTPMTYDVIQMLMEQSAAQILREIHDPGQRAIMKGVLDSIVVDYNPAVGFVDIHRAGISKFFALDKFYRRKGLTEDQVTTVHIGDSTVDSPGENEAEQAYIVALANSKPSHASKTEARGDRGLHTENDAIIGVINTVKGMIYSLQEIKRRRRATHKAA
jgi:hydroxymethylpyrimidine pyrophosphatase-like HAD family hydrolase